MVASESSGEGVSVVLPARLHPPAQPSPEGEGPPSMIDPDRIRDVLRHFVMVYNGVLGQVILSI